jgi:serine/threonine protein kinase
MEINGIDILQGLVDKTNKIIPVGATPSIGIILNINGNKYFGKGYLQPSIILDSGLEYESKIYSEIIPKLSKHSPNFVSYVGYSVISTYADDKQFKIYKDMVEDLIDVNMYLLEYGIDAPIFLDDKKTKLRPIFFTITEFIENSESLFSFISFKNPSEEDLIKILTQIIISLIFMENIGLTHNDLHIGNIMIKKLQCPTMLIYTLPNGKSITLPNVTYVSKIFDWDFGYSKELGINKKLEEDWIQEIGVKNKVDSRFDYFIVLCTLYDSIEYKSFNKITDFIQEISPQFLTFRDQIKKEPGGFNCRLQPYMMDESFTFNQSEVLQKSLETKLFKNVLFF